MRNPLLDISDLPKFSKINIQDIEPAIKKVVAENKENLKQLLKSEKKSNWIEFLTELEEMDNIISRVWSPISHLNSVMNTEALRKAHDVCLGLVSSYSTEMSQNKELYDVYLKAFENETFKSLDKTNKKIIENALLKFRLNGVALNDNKKKKFKEIKTKLASLKSQFEQNLMDATQAFKIHIDDSTQLSGLPGYVLEQAKQAAKQEDLKGWLFTLDAPSYLSVMTFSDVRKFREEIYIAFSTRASNKGPNAGEFDNTQVIENILSARKELAELLDFRNYAELSIADKMADSTQDVLDFLNELVQRSRPQAQIELKTLERFAKKECGIINLQSWDIMYVSEKLKQKQYKLSQEELKPYFPVEKVLAGLFEIVQRLYEIDIVEKENIDIWQKDVKFFEIKDSTGIVIGQFYLDLFARNHKRGGAWMDECIGRMKHNEIKQIPVAYLVCNLTPAVGNKPALLNHDEVTTLFHEFGHGLQHMLTQVDSLFVSGISAVEWDAVELPSQFMENWCWEKQALQLISAHFETAETLPESLYNKLIKAKNFQSAMQMVRQLEFSIFDIRLHMEYSENSYNGVQSLLNEIRQQVSVVIPPEINQFQHGFSHIFAGGYGAGYYSYKWAEVLSADAFSKFKENGIFDKKTGQEFRQAILETGGSEKAMQLFTRFMGREPELNALLRQCGLIENIT